MHTRLSRHTPTKEQEMRCLSDGCCQCQRILNLLTLRVIIVDRAGLQSPLMTEWLSPVHHVCTQTNMHAQSLHFFIKHTRTRTHKSLICLSLSPPQCNYADVITLD